MSTPSPPSHKFLCVKSSASNCLVPKIYDTIGLDMCIMLDVALAKGGTEAVVERVYSTMNGQSMHGGQDTKTLAVRSKLECSLPSIIQAERLVSKTAQVYIHGKERNLKSHSWPTIGAGSVRKKHTYSKVVDKHSNEECLFFFLL